MNSMHAYFNISAREIGAKLKPDGSVCPPFWILRVEWCGARSSQFWWRHLFQIVSFSPSTLENSVLKKHHFQITPLWRAFSNGSVFGDRFRRCSVDDGRIRNNTATFSFENGLVWTGLQFEGNSLKPLQVLFFFSCGYSFHLCAFGNCPWWILQFPFSKGGMVVKFACLMSSCIRAIAAEKIRA